VYARASAGFPERRSVLKEAAARSCLKEAAPMTPLSKEESRNASSADEGRELFSSSSAFKQALGELIKTPLATLVANTEYASTLLAGVLKTCSSEADGVVAVAVRSALDALAEAGTKASEISELLEGATDVAHALDGDDRAPRTQLTRYRSDVRELKRPPERYPRLLVIDDDATLGRCIQRSLRERYEVHTETNPRTAVYRLLLGEDFDAVLCDIAMPGMSGIEVFKAIAASRRELAARFVFMSGGAREVDIAEFFNHSSHVLLEKPFAMPALTKLIDDVVRLTKG
jgi:CheY-like chemotaxis protein